MPAVVAGLNVTAQCSGTALLGRRHHLELVQGQVPGVGGPTVGTCVAEDFGHLEGGGLPLPVAGTAVPGREHGQFVEQTGNGAHRAHRDLGVKRGVVEFGMHEPR